MDTTTAAAQSSSDLRQPLLDEEQAEAILHEWNASVSAFVADDGGEDNISCYCPSIASQVVNHNNSNGVNVSGITHDDDENEYYEDAQEDSAVVDSPSNNSSWCSSSTKSKLAKFCTATLLPDGVKPTINGSSSGSAETTIDDIGSGHVKFLKLVVLTFGSIALVRSTVVALGIDDMDTSLTMTEIWKYEGASILRDLLFFFVMGRMHQRSGVDTIEWISYALLANLYFESQTLFVWMQHSATPYEMHCLWPWQLWVFAIVVVLVTILISLAHVWVAAVQEHRLCITLAEVLFCVAAFVLPPVISPSSQQYVHFHHWFAGWLLGMHARSHSHWWSRATMAYCWGMYVNGIAVYGRDPLLTCDYARFLAIDQGCPMLEAAVLVEENEPMDGSGSDSNSPLMLFAKLLFSDNPPDWRNCSSSGYHP